MADLENDVQTRFIKMKLGDLYPYFDQIKELNTLQGIQARLPYDIRIN
jgi:protease-4